MEKYPLKCSRKPVQRDYGIAPMEGSLFIVGPLRDLLRGFFYICCECNFLYSEFNFFIYSERSTYLRKTLFGFHAPLPATLLQTTRSHAQQTNSLQKQMEREDEQPIHVRLMVTQHYNPNRQQSESIIE